MFWGRDILRYIDFENVVSALHTEIVELQTFHTGVCILQYKIQTSKRTFLALQL